MLIVADDLGAAGGRHSRPFIARWRGTLPPQEYSRPISTLDIAATAVQAAGLPTDDMDGVDLLPFLTGQHTGDPHDALYWRFWSQSAVRSGQWKYVRLSDGTEYLFDLESAEHEGRNRIADRPDLAESLHARLAGWAEELSPPGLPTEPLRRSEIDWYRTHLGGATNSDLPASSREAE